MADMFSQVRQAVSLIKLDFMKGNIDLFQKIGDEMFQDDRNHCFTPHMTGRLYRSSEPKVSKGQVLRIWNTPYMTQQLLDKGGRGKFPSGTPNWVAAQSRMLNLNYIDVLKQGYGQTIEDKCIRIRNTKGIINFKI